MARAVELEPRQFWVIQAEAKNMTMLEPELKFGFQFHSPSLTGK